MKICPYCKGITEEEKAIKCQICGQDISSEPEYTKEEVELTSVKQEVNQKHQQIKTRVRVKKIGIVLGSLLFFIGVFFLYLFLQPKGYVWIEKDTYTICVGETVTIQPKYGGKISENNVRIVVIGSDYDGKHPSFSYELTKDGFVFKGLLKDNLVLKFQVQDDGRQEEYNNLVKIYILPLRGHVEIPKKSEEILVGGYVELTPILSEGLTIEDVYYRYDSSTTEKNLNITILGNCFLIEALRVGTYHFTFFVRSEDTEQSKYNQHYELVVQSPPGHIEIKDKIISTKPNFPFLLTPILSEGLTIEHVQWKITQNGVEVDKVKITHKAYGFWIEVEEEGTYEIDFYVNADEEQKDYNHTVVIVCENKGEANE